MVVMKFEVKLRTHPDPLYVDVISDGWNRDRTLFLLDLDDAIERTMSPGVKRVDRDVLRLDDILSIKRLDP